MGILKCCIHFVVIMQLLEIIIALSEDYEGFENFKLKYAKNYLSDEEHQQRFKIFLQNAEHISKHNLKYAARLHSFKMAINEYADMTPEEFQEINWTNYPGNPGGGQGATFIPPFNVQPPISIDWRVLGAVTPVKKQLKCGSCWAFAATGALEGQHFRKTSQLIPLSEQNLIDCTLLEYNNHGCSGGFKERSFIYVRDNAGIDTEQSYPYQAIENPECYFNASTVGAIGKGFVVMPVGDEVALTIAVATIGPIGVDLNGKCLKLQFYEEGIYDDVDCSPTAPLKHSVLIVGYGHDDDTGMDYWIIKNSWGAEWGMEGYMKIPRFVNYAAVANRASYPLV